MWENINMDKSSETTNDNDEDLYVCYLIMWRLCLRLHLNKVFGAGLKPKSLCSAPKCLHSSTMEKKMSLTQKPPFSFGWETKMQSTSLRV